MKYLKSLRLINLMIVGLTQWIIFKILIDPFWNTSGCELRLDRDYMLPLFIITTIIITACGYLINDLFDLDTDSKNQKYKGLNSSQLLSLYFTIFTAGFLISLFIAYSLENPLLTIIYFIASGLLYFYSSTLKARPLVGNILVSLFSAMVIGIIWFAERECIASYESHLTQKIEYGLISFMTFSFIISFLRELIKDIQDIKGDSEMGMNTFPILYGISSSKKLATLLLCLLTLSLMYWGFLVVNFQSQLSLLILVVLSILILVTFFIIVKAKSTRAFYFTSNFIKLQMLMGLIYLISYAKDLWTF